MDMSTVKALAIPEGDVAVIRQNGTKIWQRLPWEYQEVEWIGSDGNQFLELNTYNMTGDTTYDEKLIASDIVYSYRKGMTGTGAYKYSLVCYANTLRWCVKSAYYDVTEDITAKHTYEYGTAYLKVDGVSKSSASDSNVNSSAKKMLFKSVYGCLAGRVYYYGISLNNALVEELIPCYRKSDNVIGMYDMVNGTFYTNQGTGTFTKGNDK